MAAFLVLKLGSTYPAMRESRGDFEDWILAGLGVERDEVHVVDVPTGEPLPDEKTFSGVAITGSHAMVTQRHAWSERTAGWLPALVERGVPVLAICYGHQLLAEALGGRAEDNPNGRQFGTVEVTLQTAAEADPLFAGLASPCRLHVTHTQSVVSLPPGARRLASSARDPHLAFAVGECAWGVQFHPEFDRQIVCHYIEAHRQELAAQGDDPDRLIADCTDTPDGAAVLRRFAEIVHERTSA
jgi:GMP synthase (glutamine-hydrolysing)